MHLQKTFPRENGDMEVCVMSERANFTIASSGLKQIFRKNVFLSIY